MNTNIHKTLIPSFQAEERAHLTVLILLVILLLLLLCWVLKLGLGTHWPSVSPLIMLKQSLAPFFQAELHCALEARLGFELEIFQSPLQNSWKYRLAPPTNQLSTFCFWDRVTLHTPACPGMCYVEEAGLELTEFYLSLLQGLALKMWATMSSLIMSSKWHCNEVAASDSWRFSPSPFEGLCTQLHLGRNCRYFFPFALYKWFG